MSKQLWSDNDIEQVGAIVGRDGMMGLYVHFPIVKNIRNAYERELATRNEMIGNLQNDLGKKQAYIAEQEKIILSGAQMYHAERALREQAQARITELEAEVKRLRELVYLAHADDCTCKICTDARMPNPIICCICGQPITGIEIDHRFWLHRIGCNGGECDCDLECHDECYDGHEHEYAPLFDDHDDE